MTPRDNLIAALDGRRPERIPFTVNQEFVTDDPAWEALFAAGLCPIPYVHTVREEMLGIERVRSRVDPARASPAAGFGTGRQMELVQPLACSEGYRLIQGDSGEREYPMAAGPAEVCCRAVCR